MKLWALPLLALCACSAANDALDGATRRAAETTINGVVTDRFPGVDPAPVTSCVVNNADRSELFALAKDAVTGVDGQTAATVIDILKRSGTLKCLLKNSVPLLV